jgi:hypothetical protein
MSQVRHHPRPQRPQRQDRLEPMPAGWLLARDLRDTPQLAATRLTQHQIAAHRTWGCSTGLQVTVTSNAISVSPGIAIDRRGRIGLLARAVQCPRAVASSAGSGSGSGQSLTSAVSVVLTVDGDGPAARVHLRHPGRLLELDIPLAAVDRGGEVHDGDGDRQWLRHPGPARCFSGLVPRGAPVTGIGSEWTAHVDLTAHQLDGAPAVVVAAAGPVSDPATTRTTFEVSKLGPGGFDVLVRHHVRVGEMPSTTAIATAPQALSWVALLGAPRPAIPSALTTAQEQS